MTNINSTEDLAQFLTNISNSAIIELEKKTFINHNALFEGPIFKKIETSVLVHPSAQDDSLFGTLQIVAHPTEEATEADYEGNLDLDDSMANAFGAAIRTIAYKLAEAFNIGLDDKQFTYYFGKEIGWVFCNNFIPLDLLAVQRKDNSLHIIISNQA